MRLSNAPVIRQTISRFVNVVVFLSMDDDRRRGVGEIVSSERRWSPTRRFAIARSSCGHKGRADYREDLHAPESSAMCSIRRPRSPRVLANMPFNLRSTLSHVAENK